MDTIIVLKPDRMRSGPQTEQRTLYFKQLISQVHDRSCFCRAPQSTVSASRTAWGLVRRVYSCGVLTIRKGNIYEAKDEPYKSEFRALTEEEEIKMATR